MDINSINTEWRRQVEIFAEQMSQQNGLSSVKDLCRFLLEEQQLGDREQVVEYLRDFRDVSRAHLAFHKKWSALRNMGRLADYDRREVEAANKMASSSCL